MSSDSKPGAAEPSMEEILSSIRQIISEEEAAEKAATSTEVPEKVSIALAPSADESQVSSFMETADQGTEDVLELTEMVSEDEEKENNPLKAEENLIEDTALSNSMSSLDLSQFNTSSSDTSTVSSIGNRGIIDPRNIQHLNSILEEAGEEPPAPVTTSLPPITSSSVPPLDPLPSMLGGFMTSSDNDVSPSIPQNPSVTPHIAAASTEELISPTAAAAAKAAFQKLLDVTHYDVPYTPDPAGGHHHAIGGRTVEELMCDLMRPLLKEWIEKNLPKIVEGLVAEEIKKLAEKR